MIVFKMTRVWAVMAGNAQSPVQNCLRFNRMVWISGLACLIFLTFSLNSQAAYCSLRDPVLAINTLYPGATSHRSVVRVVDQQARMIIAARLPFTLHFNELGKHTLYIAMKDFTPLGFIHARSEPSDWGLIEVAWAINPEMGIDGFFLQRCRDPKCSDQIFIEKVSEDLKGKNFNTMITLLNSKKDALSQKMSERYGSNQSLFFSIIKSALKTILATEISWAEDVKQAKTLKVVQSVLNDANVVLVPINKGMTPRTAAPSGTMVDLKSVENYKVIRRLKGSPDQEVARLVNSEWQQGRVGGNFTWLFSLSGDVIDVRSFSGWPSSEIAAEFKRMIGKNVALEEQCNTATDIAGHELFKLSRE